MAAQIGFLLLNKMTNEATRHDEGFMSRPLLTNNIKVIEQITEINK